MMNRRNFLEGIIAAAVAPAFVKTAGLLMPIKPLIVIPEITFHTADEFDRQQFLIYTELSLAS